LALYRYYAEAQEPDNAGMEFFPAHGQLAHFSINVNDMDRAQHFYGGVFGWKFHAYGPPGFFMMELVSPDAKPVPQVASMQGRREIVAGTKMHGPECTVAVSDIDETIEKIVSLGGKIVMQKCTLPSIGHLVFFQDPEDNILGAMQYDSKAQ
jgi:predicted enzyme related to lactoylglutathione lyase